MREINEQVKFRRGLTLKNRLVMAPMTVKMSFYDGTVTKDELDYYHLHADGLGAVITGAANVEDGGKGWDGEESVADDKFIPGLSKLAGRIKREGTRAILQLFHAGRMTDSKVLRGEQPVAPSAVAAERPGAETPREMRDDEILGLIESFAQATKRAIAAGFDGVELHGANTYIIQQFFSPHSNRRTDIWGGSLEKRYHFIDELVDTVTSVVDESGVKDFVVGYRFSPEEYEEPGIRFKDTLWLVDKLADKPLDYLHVSLPSWKKVSDSPEYQDKSMLAYIHETIANRVPLIGVGDVHSKSDVEDVLKDSELVAVGRALLFDPQWTSKMLRGEEEKIKRRVSMSDMELLLISNGTWEFLEMMSAEKLDKD